MHPISLLQTWLERNQVIGHSARVGALLRVVESLLSGASLCLTHLGRHRAGDAYAKHHIKAVDRLLGNAHLYGERAGIYRAFAATVLGGMRRPIIVIDWADTAQDRKWQILRASVPVDGRALTVYEEVHPMARYNNPRTHREFLNALADVLPARCRPVIVTDAGFRGPWFRQVESHGWDWVGRIRNKVKYLNPTTNRWCFTDSLYREATSRVRHLGKVLLSRRHRYSCRLYLVRAYKLRPGRRPKRLHHSTNTGLYRKLHKAPWLLATSLPHTAGAGKIIKALYAKRMSIEESFRDLKNPRWGHALRYARSHRACRIETLLVLALLASLVQWLLGLVARTQSWAKHFQANTERKRRTLSTVFIGQQMLESNRFKPTPTDIAAAFRRLSTLVKRDAEYA